MSSATFTIDAGTKEELDTQLLELYEDMRKKNFWIETITPLRRRWMTTVRITDVPPGHLTGSSNHGTMSTLVDNERSPR